MTPCTQARDSLFCSISTSPEQGSRQPKPVIFRSVPRLKRGPPRYSPSLLLRFSGTSLTKVENQPLDWSACNSLIFIIVASALCGLRAFRDSHVAETIGLRRAESDDGGVDRPRSEVRKNPREPHGTRGDRRKKSNQRTGWIFNMVVRCGPGFKSTCQTQGHRLFYSPNFETNGRFC